MVDNSSLIIEKATKSVKWSAFMEIVSRAISPIVYVILARLLAPRDFGIVATAMIVINFSRMFWDAGLGKALMQTNERTDTAANIVFWTNLVLGILIYLAIYVAAPHIASFFNSPDSMPILRVLGILVIVDSLSSVQQSLFMRELDFRKLFWMTLGSALVPGVFSIPLAFAGYGVWALVAGALASSVARSGSLWFLSTWRPTVQFDVRLARQLFRFGVWVIGESIASWFFAWGDRFLVGKFLGMEALGVYRLAFVIANMIFGLALNPFLPVLYPTFCRLHNDSNILKDAFHRVNKVIITLSLPMGTGLMLIAPLLSSSLFGEKWNGLGVVLGIIGFMLGLAWTVGINTELYRAMGRPEVNTKLMIVCALLYFPAYFAAAHHGLVLFTFTRLAVTLLIGIPIQVFVCSRMLRVSNLYLWHDGKATFLSTLSMASIVTIQKWFFASHGGNAHPFMILFIMVLTGMITYGIVLWALDRSFFLQTRDLFKKAVMA